WAQLPPAPTALSAEQHFALGLIFASGGAYSAAISHFQQTLRLEPTSYLASYNLALAYRQEGKSQAENVRLQRSKRRRMQISVRARSAAPQRGHIFSKPYGWNRRVIWQAII